MKNDHSPSQDSLGFIIYRTALALKSALQRFFKENGFEITAEQWAIIRHLWEEDGLSCPQPKEPQAGGGGGQGGQII